MSKETNRIWTPHKLIIAEKPSVARTIAEVLGVSQQDDPKHIRYLFNDEWIISWCIGHLVELAMPQDYDKRYEKWRGEDLPILPQPWKYTVTKKTKDQFEMLSFLLTHEKVTEVVCATDAGREGELIFRLVYHQCGSDKPVKRLWISSLEESAIRDGMNHLRDSSDFDLLYEAALCRQKADWLIGINASRIFSLIYSQTMNIGRVMTPTLFLVTERENAIARFKPEKFYTVQLSCGFPASGERLKDPEEAKRIAAACSMKTARVLKVDRREKKENPPKLYDLTTLQRDANRIFGFTAQQTLDYAQALYEKKLITYPRTDSQYLTDDMEESIAGLVPLVANCFPYISGMAITTDVRQVINSEKVTDHHAIIPTKAMTTLPWGDIPAQEKVLLSLICNRLICGTGAPYEYSETEVVVECEGHYFTGKGKSEVQVGWKLPHELFMNSLKQKNEESEDPQKERVYNIQEVQPGQRIYPCLSSVKEGETTPPKHFTEDTLLAAMENAGTEGLPEDAERRGLGTPATRAGILEKLVQAEMLERKGAGKQRELFPTDKGKMVIAAVPALLKHPILTTEWEVKLKEIEHGDEKPEVFLEDIEKLIGRVMRMDHPEGCEMYLANKDKVGVCPSCGAPVIEHSEGFFCENRLCRFAIWKDNRFFTSKKKKVTRNLVTILLKEKIVEATDLYSPKTGKTYSATIVLETDEEGRSRFKLIYQGKERKPKGVMTS